MSKHTYTHNSIAHRANGFAIIPDDVALDQHAWDASRKSFQAFPCTSTGKIIGKGFSAVLRGDLYGLHTTGTGDCTIRNA